MNGTILAHDQILSQKLVEYSPVPTAILNAGGLFQYVNPSLSQLSGHQRNALIGQSLFLMMPTEGVQAQQIRAYFLGTTEKPYSHTGQFLPKDKHPLVAEWTLVRLPPEPDGTHLYLLQIITNSRIENPAQKLQSPEATVRSLLGKSPASISQLLVDLKRLLGCDFIHMMTVTQTDTTIIDDQHLDFQQSDMRQLIENHSIFRQIVQSETILVVEDKRSFAGWMDIPGFDVICSYVGIPIWNQEQIVGFLNLGSQTPGFFSRWEPAWYGLLGKYVEAVLQSSILAERVERRILDINSLFTITMAAASAGTLETGLQQVAPLLLSWLQASAVTFYLPNDTLDHNGQTTLLPVISEGGLIADDVEEIIVAEDTTTLIGMAAYQQSPIMVDNLADEQGYSPNHPGAMSAMIIPLSVADEMVGLISIEYEREAQYDVESPAPLLTLANTLAAIFSHAKLLESVQDSEERFRQVAENIHEVFWLIDPFSREVIFVSHAFEAIWGRSREELYEDRSLSSWIKTLHSDDRDLFLAKIKEAAVNRDIPHAYEYRILRTDGEIRWIRMVTYPVRNSLGIIYRLAAIAEDITEHKQAEAQTIELTLEKEKVRLLQEFVSDASHDLKTPLSTIFTSLHLLKKKNPELDNEYLKRLEAEAVRLKNLLEDLLTMSRIDGTGSSFTFQTVDLNELVQEVIAEQHSLVAQKRHIVYQQLDTSSPQAYVDRFEFSRALMNLLVNALNYTPEQGVITVRTQKYADFHIIEIRDNGIGITSEDLPHIFKRFYRADKARRSDTGGTGLGLAIVQKIIDAHGGRIEVESELYRGSTFRVILPVQANSA